MEDKKIDDKTIEVERVVTQKVNYNIDYLYQQLAAVQAQKIRDSAQRDLEIIQIQELISRAESLGIQKSPDVINPILNV